LKYTFLRFPSSFFWQNTTVKYGKELHTSRIVDDYFFLILSYGTKSSTSYLKKKIVLSKLVPEEILKIKYCLVEQNKKERENYICL
jgi:hypothetical protein